MTDTADSPPARHSPAARLGAVAVAALGGALWALPFGIEPHTVAPWIALVPLFLLLEGRRPLGAFGLGWLHGVLFWLVSIPWIAPTMETFGHLPSWLAAALLLLLALYLGVYHGLFAALGAPLWRAGRTGPLLPLAALPALWVGLEWVRGWLMSGFPWNLAGYAWTEVPGALPSAAWIGAWGVSYLVLFANCGVALAVVSLVRARRSGRGGVRWWRQARWAPGALGVLLPLLLLALAARYAVPGFPAGDGIYRQLDPRGDVLPGRAVHLVQPEIYNQAEYDPAVTAEGYRRLLRLTEEACGRPPDAVAAAAPGSGPLVIWPESATWPFDLERDPHLERDVEGFAERGCPVLLNSTRREGGDVYFNSAYLVSGEGETARYDKRHLVPFGEYVPLSGIFSFLDSLARSAGDYTAADQLRLLPWGDERIGMAICFEVTFPSEVAELARAGATVLVTITNDAWYGDSAAPRQHFRAARWRAAETGRPLLRAAITGISAEVAPDGSVRRSLGVGERGVIRARVAGRSGITPFAAAPWAVPTASCLLATFAIILALRRNTP